MELQTVKTNLRDLTEILDEVYDWTATELERVIEAQRNKLSLKPPQYLMPLRLIVTGRKDSPPLFQTLEVLGREIVRYRLRDGEQKITQ
jgi:glutamyl-tRNA synthetase